MAEYVPTVWVNNTSPAMTAANLNKLTDELESQATAISLLHTLPTWADGVAPAITDAAPWNEMERVVDQVAASQGLSYAPTVWENGWTPARNAARLNKLEAQAQANRAALESVVPAANDQAGLQIFNYGGSAGTLNGIGGDSTKFPYLSIIVYSAHQTANIANFVAYSGTKGRALCYKTISETAATNSATSWANVPTTQTVPAETRRSLTGAVPADEVKYHDLNNPSDQWMLWSSAGNPLFYGSYFQSFIVDPASGSYQARAYQYLLDQITSRGYDGIWSDNILVSTQVTGGFPFYRRNSSGQLVVAYADAPSFANAMVSCTQQTLGRLKTDGYYVGGNCHYFEPTPALDYNNGTRVATWIGRLAPYLNTCTTEYSSFAAGAPSSRAVPTVQWYDYWEGWTQWTREAALADGAGHAQGIGSSNVDQVMRYAMGTVRTSWNGIGPPTAVAFFSPYWPSAYTEIEWGTSVGTMMVNGPLHARRWTGGWAVINTSRSPASATFTDPLLGGSRSFTIPAVDAHLGP